jgi:hypothetical protein
VIVAVFRRRLKSGKSFADFQRAWEAEQGFGVPTRVFNAVNLADERDVISIGFVAVEPEQLEAGIARVAGQEQGRHSRIAEVIESTDLRAMYRLTTEHDLSAAPREIELGSAESLLRAFAGDAAVSPREPR